MPWQRVAPKRFGLFGPPGGSLGVNSGYRSARPALLRTIFLLHLLRLWWGYGQDAERLAHHIRDRPQLGGPFGVSVEH